jgi:hypothetical protein
MQWKLSGIINVNFDVTGQLDVNKFHDSARNDGLYYVPIESGITVSTIGIGFKTFQSRSRRPLTGSSYHWHRGANRKLIKLI